MTPVGDTLKKSRVERRGVQGESLKLQRVDEATR